MITSIARYVTDFLLRENVICAEYADLYIYGFEVIQAGAVNIMIVLFMGLLFDQLINGLIFWLEFCMLRKFCGGYHADTYLNCKIIFGITCLMSTIISKYFYSIFKMPYIIIMGLIYLIIVILLCPCENKHKKLTEQIKRKNKIISIIYSILILSASIFLYNSYKKISVVILITTIFVGIYVCIAKLTERRKCYVKDI